MVLVGLQLQLRQVVEDSHTGLLSAGAEDVFELFRIDHDPGAHFVHNRVLRNQMNGEFVANLKEKLFDEFGLACFAKEKHVLELFFQQLVKLVAEQQLPYWLAQVGKDNGFAEHGWTAVVWLWLFMDDACFVSVVLCAAFCMSDFLKYIQQVIEYVKCFIFDL